MKKIQVLGFGLIILSWVFWGLIIIIPFLNLGLKTTSIAITILLIVSNIFWLGVILVGKEFLPKYILQLKKMKWFGKLKF
jgi:hypothetical protein